MHLFRWMLLASLPFTLAAAARPAVAQQDIVVIEITNLNSLKGEEEADPKDVAKGVLQAMGEEELAGKAFFMSDDHGPGGASATDMIMSLIQLAAPEQCRVMMRNGRIAVAPIDDFDRFCDGLTFGRIVSKDRRLGNLEIRVDPAALDADAIRRRARDAGRTIMLEARSRVSARGRRGDAIAKSPINPDGFQIGDRVDCQYNGVWAAAELIGEGGFDYPTVKIENPADLVPALLRKSDAKRLRALASLLLPADPVRMRSARMGASAPRTWQDSTGRFTISASLESVEGQTAVLKRTDGRTVRVPIAKLCEADQQFIASGGQEVNEENPFAVAEPKQAADTRLQADISGLRQVPLRKNASWRFSPSDAAPTPTLASAKTVDLPQIRGSDAFFEEYGGIHLSASGKRLAIERKHGQVGGDAQWYLDCVAPVSGQHRATIALPAESVVLDTLLEKGIVLARADGFRVDETTVYVYRLGAREAEMVAHWQPYVVGGHFGGADVKHAQFLGPDLVMTRGDMFKPPIVWDWKTAEAKYALPKEANGVFGAAVGPHGRLYAAVNQRELLVFDLARGRHVGTLPLPEQTVRLDAIAFSPDQTALAAVGGGALLTWDLASGELTRRLYRPEIHFADTLEWVGEYLLVDHKYLYDPRRRILLWEFEIGGRASHGSATRVANGRLWFAPRTHGREAPYVASVSLSHPAIHETAASLGEPEDLLVARPGDAVEVALDLAPGLERRHEVRPAVEQNLRDAGFEIADSADIVVTVVCKQLPSQEIHIDPNPRGSLRRKRDEVITRTITPYQTKIAMLVGGREVYSRGQTYSPGMTIWLEEGESIDAALKRLTTPNVGFILLAKFNGEVARPGDATKNGAYGFSKLTSAGVLEDVTVLQE
ncbi:hypothetical protein KOR34_39930 [Posidoniimonas corsicana]|uniref:SLA1 homology domain-containing protein n=1 Tax=Posidoniimonas corsicana TaxID=1938618 RepID=A0A5C5V1G7_9BACT|nr:SHD1 domain-containing protein [Posidoniimonas corsicana]TWT32231.1 hypothetical protein KOR34_39930 [Posidoniimonas corsicana]